MLIYVTYATHYMFWLWRPLFGGFCYFIRSAFLFPESAAAYFSTSCVFFFFYKYYMGIASSARSKARYLIKIYEKSWNLLCGRNSLKTKSHCNSSPIYVTAENSVCLCMHYTKEVKKRKVVWWHKQEQQQPKLGCLTPIFKYVMQDDTYFWPVALKEVDVRSTPEIENIMSNLLHGFAMHTYCIGLAKRIGVIWE